MPLYEYQCADCETPFEVRATFKEKEAGLQPLCPKCHSKATRQVLTSTFLVRHGGDGASLDMPMCGPNSGPGCCGG